MKEIYPSHPECPLPVSMLDDFENAALRYLNKERTDKEIDSKTSVYGGAQLNVKD